MDSESIYWLTKKTRFAKAYWLKRQIRRETAGSSMHNIAQGFNSRRMGSSCGFYDTRSGRARRTKAKELNNREPLNPEPNNLSYV
ncbi:MAG: four helix bundle protein [Deltaproteobacteria bacterium]|nr:four helix bundle protein [Deltaproteobacteria bacterium]